MAELRGSPQVFHGNTDQVDASQQVPLGTRGFDSAGGEYIYLKGVGSTVAGSWVVFDEDFATTLLVANEVGPVGIAMAAIDATTEYGWYQIFGKNTIASTDTVAADKPLYIDGTAGRADDAGVAGDLIIGAYSMTADTSNVATVFLNYPHVSDELGASSGSVGGSDTQVQFNDGGTVNGDAGFVYNKTTDTATLAGNLKCEDLELEDSDASHYLTITTTSNLTAGRTLTLVPGDASRTITLAGNLNIAADFITSGANSLTLTTTGATDVTLPTTGTLVTLAGSETLTNKTLTAPVLNAVPTFSLDDSDSAFNLTIVSTSTLTAGRTLTIDVEDAAVTLRLAANFITAGANSLTLTTTGATNVTLPTTGTLATLAGTETLTNKTLTAPKFADLGFIADANGNEIIILDTVASAVNELTIANAATGTSGPLLIASGETNVDLRLSAKGTGAVHIITGSYGDLTADTDGATITFNLATSNIHTVTLGGNRTLALSNEHVGQCFMLRLLQDGTGSRTVTWFTTIKWAGGSAPTLTTTANKADILGFIVTSAANYDGFVVGANI